MKAIRQKLFVIRLELQLILLVIVQSRPPIIQWLFKVQRAAISILQIIQSLVKPLFHLIVLKDKSLPRRIILRRFEHLILISLLPVNWLETLILLSRLSHRVSRIGNLTFLISLPTAIIKIITHFSDFKFIIFLFLNCIYLMKLFIF